MIWDSVQLARYLDEGELDLATQLHCIIDRTSFSIVAGTYEYSLPAPALGIKRLTWLGKKLDPISYLNWVFDYQPILDSGALTPSSTPYFYVYSDIGLKSVIFYPVPDITIESTEDNLWGSAIPDKVIAEYYRLPDTSDSVFRVPVYYRRRIVKCYALWKLLGQEGDGQDIEASRYYKNKYDYYVYLSHVIYNKVFVSKLRGYAPSVSRRTRPERPVLPPNFPRRS